MMRLSSEMKWAFYAEITSLYVFTTAQRCSIWYIERKDNLIIKEWIWAFWLKITLCCDVTDW